MARGRDQVGLRKTRNCHTPHRHMYTYSHTYTHTHIYTYTHTHIHTHTHTHTHTFYTHLNRLRLDPLMVCTRASVTLCATSAPADNAALPPDPNMPRPADGCSCTVRQRRRWCVFSDTGVTLKEQRTRGRTRESQRLEPRVKSELIAATAPGKTVGHSRDEPKGEMRRERERER